MTTRQTENIDVESMHYRDTRRNNPTPESAGAMAANDPDFAQDALKPHPASAAAEKQAAELNEYLRGLMGGGGVSIEDLPRIRMMLDGEQEPAYPRLTWRKGEGVLRGRTYGNLYTHDKVVSEDIIAGLLKNERFKKASLLFEPERSFPPEAFFNPYRYEGDWSNRLIRASAQRAMASMLYKDKMRGKVQLVYMDPPYNISFSNQFAVTANTTTNDAGDIPPDARRIKAFRDSYKDGVHSYLDGLKEQMELAKELLHESGSFVMQIGPDNLHQVAMLMSEIFGSNNHIATIPYKTGNNPGKYLTRIGNWLVWFAKDQEKLKYRQLYEKQGVEFYIRNWPLNRGEGSLQAPDGSRRKLKEDEIANPRLIPSDHRLYMRLVSISSSWSSTGRSDTFYWHENDAPCDAHPDAWDDHECSKLCDAAESDNLLKPNNNRACPKGRKCGENCQADAFPCPADKHWSVSLKGLHSIAIQGRLLAGDSQLNIQRFQDEHPGSELVAWWTDAGRVSNKQYIVQTQRRVLERVLLMSTDPGDLVLDLTCGSGAMPIRAEEWGRRWVAIDVSAVSIAIARECIATTLYTNHLLADSAEGAPIDHKLEQELWPSDKRIPFRENEDGYNEDPSKGFVNERQLRVSPKTLAYGPTATDIIRHPGRTIKSTQQKVRAASPFTVESDSPFRSIRPNEVLEDSDVRHQPDTPTMGRIVEALLKSGIRQAGRLIYKVEDLLPVISRDVTHQATLVAADSEERKPALFYIASEDETITTTRIGNAARHVMRDPGYSDLVVVGFDRDAAALPESRLDAYAGVDMMIVEPNRDLHLPGLEHTESDNAFEIVSEPIVRLHRQEDGKAALEVVGVNAYDPRNLNVRSTDVHDIMGILVDTEYDGEQFNVHLMNVVECDRNRSTIENLREGLGRGLNENNFKRFKGKTSRPFNLPTDGSKVAVKVIDQTGIEHMAVLDEDHFGE